MPGKVNAGSGRDLASVIHLEAQPWAAMWPWRSHSVFLATCNTREIQPVFSFNPQGPLCGLKLTPDSATVRASLPGQPDLELVFLLYLEPGTMPST